VIHPDSSLLQGLELPVDDCRLQLDRILKSDDFEATVRERRFLSHVIEETLAGRGSRIKAYSIAVEAFGRDASFDPQNDPIVRIMAGALRRSLERYYLTAGHSDPIVITIPKGSYVPTFLPRPSPVVGDTGSSIVAARNVTAPNWHRPTWLTLILSFVLAAVAMLAYGFQASDPGPAAPGIPHVLVERLEDLTRSEDSADIAIGLTQEIIRQLSKFKDIVVVESMEAGPIKAPIPPRFNLSGSIRISGNSFRLRARLIDMEDQSVLWAENFDGGLDVAQLLKAQGDIADGVATSLAQTYGVIFQANSRLGKVDAPDDWTAYSCTLSYYAYHANLDQTALPQVRACLEKVVHRFPNYATAWGLLALVNIEEVRYRFPVDPVSWQASVDRALEASRHAVQIDPFNVRGLQAEMFALFFGREFEAARSVGERAMAINPNDTELMGEYGFRLALSGEWSKGCPLLATARERNPGPFSYYETGLALCAYIEGDYEQAGVWIRKTTIPTNPFYHLIAAAIAGEVEDSEKAGHERAWLLQNAPALTKKLRQELSVRLGKPEDVELIMNSLRKAGLDIEG
jgi:TolB-like protein